MADQPNAFPNALSNPFLPPNFLPPNFMSPDLARMFTGMRFPGLEVEALLDAHRKNLAAFVAANQLVAESAQALARRQSEILRECMEETSSMLREAMSPDAPEIKVERQTELMKRSYDRALGNMREMGELVAKSSGETFEVVNSRVCEGFDEFRSAVSPRGPARA